MDDSRRAPRLSGRGCWREGFFVGKRTSPSSSADSEGAADEDEEETEEPSPTVSARMASPLLAALEKMSRLDRPPEDTLLFER
jgi:hypothetical protein